MSETGRNNADTLSQPDDGYVTVLLHASVLRDDPRFVPKPQDFEGTETVAQRDGIALDL